MSKLFSSAGDSSGTNSSAFSFGAKEGKQNGSSLFGSSNTSSGESNTSGLGLFGAKSQTTSSAFGSTTSTSLFGTTAAKGTGGLFGGKPTAQGATRNFGTAGSTFGTTSAGMPSESKSGDFALKTTGSVFGSSTTGPQKQETEFGFGSNPVPNESPHGKKRSSLGSRPNYSDEEEEEEEEEESSSEENDESSEAEDESENEYDENNPLLQQEEMSPKTPTFGIDSPAPAQRSPQKEFSQTHCMPPRAQGAFDHIPFTQSRANHRPCLKAYAPRGRDFFVYDPELGTLGAGTLEDMDKTKKRFDASKNEDALKYRNLPCFPLLPTLPNGELVSMSTNATGSCLLIAGTNSVALVRLPMMFDSVNPRARDGIKLAGIHNPDTGEVELVRRSSMRFASAIGGLGGDEETGYSGFRSLSSDQRMSLSGTVQVELDEHSGTHKPCFRGEFRGFPGRFELRPETGGRTGGVFAKGDQWSGHCDLLLPGLPRKSVGLSMEVLSCEGEKLSCSFGEVVVELVDDWLYGGHVSNCHVVQASWHPSCTNQVIILDSDNMLRQYDIRKDLDAPVLEMKLGSPEDGNKVTSFVFASRDTHSKVGAAVSYQVWRRLALFALRENGEVLMLCPFAVGGGDNVPVTQKEANQVVMALETHFNDSQEEGDLRTVEMLEEQLEWAKALKKSFDPADESEKQPEQPSLEHRLLGNTENTNIQVTSGQPVSEALTTFGGAQETVEDDDEESCLLRLPCIQSLTPPCNSPDNRKQKVVKQGKSRAVSLSVSVTRDGAFTALLRTWSCGRVETLVRSSPIEAHWSDIIIKPLKAFAEGPRTDEAASPYGYAEDTPSRPTSPPPTTPRKQQVVTEEPQRPERSRNLHSSPGQLNQRIRETLFGEDLTVQEDEQSTPVHDAPLSSHRRLGMSPAVRRLMSPMAEEAIASQALEVVNNKEEHDRTFRNTTHLVHCLEVVNASTQCDCHLELFPDSIFADVVYCADVNTGAVYALQMSWFNALAEVVVSGDRKASNAFVSQCHWTLLSRMVVSSSGSCRVPAASFAVVTEPGLGHWLLGPKGKSGVANCVDLSVEVSRLRFSETAKASDTKGEPDKKPGLSSLVLSAVEQAKALQIALNKFTDLPEQLRGLQLDTRTPDPVGVAASDWLLRTSHALIGGGASSQSNGSESLLHGIASGYQLLKQRRAEQKGALRQQLNLLKAIQEDLKELHGDRTSLQEMSGGVRELQSLTEEGVHAALERSRLLHPSSSLASKAFVSEVKRVATESDKLMALVGEPKGLKFQLDRLESAETSLQDVLRGTGLTKENSVTTLSAEEEECIQGLQQGTENILTRMLGTDAESATSLVGLKKRMEVLKKQVVAITANAVEEGGMVLLLAPETEDSRYLSEDLESKWDGFKVQKKLLGREYQSKVRRTLGVDAVCCPYLFPLGEPRRDLRAETRCTVHIVLLDEDWNYTVDPAEESEEQVVKLFCGEKIESHNGEFESVVLVQHNAQGSPVTLWKDISDVVGAVEEMLEDSTKQSGARGNAFRRIV